MKAHQALSLTGISIGYIIMLWPSCIIISHIGPSKWLPACEVRKKTPIMPLSMDSSNIRAGYLGNVDMLSIGSHQPQSGLDNLSIYKFLQTTNRLPGLWPSVPHWLLRGNYLACVLHHDQVCSLSSSTIQPN